MATATATAMGVAGHTTSADADARVAFPSLPGMLGDEPLMIGRLGDNGVRARNREVVLPECRSLLRP